MKVLVGEISSYKAIVICKFLHKTYPGLRIITYDYLSFTKAFRSKYSHEHHLLKYSSKEHYIKELAALVDKLGIDLFFPVHSEAIEDILKMKNIFGGSLNYLGSLEDYHKLHDKHKLGTLARQLHIPVPEEYDSFSAAKIPFVAKPRDKSSSKGVLYINDQKSFGNYKNDVRPGYIYQDFIPGIGCGYSVFCENGRIVQGYGHKRLAEYPVSGGSSVYRGSFFVPEMKTIAEMILGSVKWSGFAMFEYKYTPEGKIVLIEVNPRIWGSINQGLQNNVNYFDSIIPLTPVSNGQNNGKQFTYLSPQIHVSFIKYIIKGKVAPIKDFLKHLRKNEPDVSLFGDAGGWFSSILRSVLK